MLFFAVLIIISLFFSRYLLSVGMFGWLALSFFEAPVGRWRWKPWFTSSAYSPSEKVMFAFPIVFLLAALSLLWSSPNDFAWSRLRLALPFLGLPLAFLHLPRLNRRDLDFLWIVLVFTAIVSVLGVLYVLLLVGVDTSILEKGQHLPTPVNHIRYSILLAISSLFAFNLYYHRSPLLPRRWVRISFLLLSIVLALFVMYLSVRSGWAALLMGFGLTAGQILWRERDVKKLVWILLSFAVFSMVAYFTFPTIQKKINYSISDFNQYMKGGGDHYSDATRWRSMEIAGRVFLRHPFLGTGVGDLKSQVQVEFQDRYPGSSKFLLPHNQYMYWLAGYGFLGFLLLLAVVLQPLRVPRAKKDIGHLQVQLIFLAAFLVEASWQSSLGIGIHLVFTLLYLSHFSKIEKKE